MERLNVLLPFARTAHWWDGERWEDRAAREGPCLPGASLGLASCTAGHVDSQVRRPRGLASLNDCALPSLVAEQQVCNYCERTPKELHWGSNGYPSQRDF